MILNHLTITNYRNIGVASLEFSPNINCLVGANGMGKSNVLDAIYYLSFAEALPVHRTLSMSTTTQTISY